MPRSGGRGRGRGCGSQQTASLVQQTAIPREVSVRRSLAACATIAWEGRDLKVSLNSNPTRWQFTTQVIGCDRTGDVTTGNFDVDVKAPNGKRARHTLRSLDYSSWLAPLAAVSNSGAAAAAGRCRRSSNRVPPDSPTHLNGGASSSSMPLLPPLPPLPSGCAPAFSAFQQSAAAMQAQIRAAEQRLARAKAAKAEATVGAKAVVAACDDPDEMGAVLSSWHDKLVRCDEEMRAASTALGKLQAAAAQSTSQVSALLNESSRQKHQAALKRAAAQEAVQQQRDEQTKETEALWEQVGLRRGLHQELERQEAAFENPNVAT